MATRRAAKRPFTFFDANVTLGRPKIPKYHTVEDPRMLRKELAGLGITGGLVRHAFCLAGAPAEANGMLSRALTGVRGYQPVWTVMPHWTGEFPEPGELAKEMSTCGVRAVIAYPSSHGYSMSPSTVGPLLELLESVRVPLFLPCAETPLRTVEELLGNYPCLPIIASDMGYRLTRELYPLLRLYKNLYLEISGFMVNMGIEEICGKFGPQHLIFGTRYPLYNPGCAVAYVMYADIEEEARALIAGGNIRRLLREVQLK